MPLESGLQHPLWCGGCGLVVTAICSIVFWQEVSSNLVSARGGRCRRRRRVLVCVVGPGLVCSSWKRRCGHEMRRIRPNRACHRSEALLACFLIVNTSYPGSSSSSISCCCCCGGSCGGSSRQDVQCNSIVDVLERNIGAGDNNVHVPRLHSWCSPSRASLHVCCCPWARNRPGGECLCHHTLQVLHKCGVRVERRIVQELKVVVVIVVVAGIAGVCVPTGARVWAHMLCPRACMGTHVQDVCVCSLGLSTCWH